MSSNVGAIHASVLQEVQSQVFYKDSFDYFLNSLAKKGMPLGLQCYSEPMLLKKETKNKLYNKPSLRLVFKFIKQHYKTRWIFLLFLIYLSTKKKFLYFH